MIYTLIIKDIYYYIYTDLHFK